MNKVIKFLFAIDLFAGLSLITTFISKLCFSSDKFFFIIIAIAFALVNLIITLIFTKKFNFYKNITECAKK